MIKYMNESVFSKTKYMNEVGFEILARTPVPQLPLSYPLSCHSVSGHVQIQGWKSPRQKLGDERVNSLPFFANLHKNNKYPSQKCL